MIEMMVTLTILAIVALALADGLVSSMRVTTGNEERAAAMRAARDKLEWVVAHKQLIVNSVPSGPQISAPATNRSVPPPLPRFVVDAGKDYGVIKGTEYAGPGSIPGAPVVTLMLPGGPSATSPVYDGGPFDVYFAQKGAANGANPNQIRMPGLFGSALSNHGSLSGEKSGEIVLMFDEANPKRADFATSHAYAYGRDLTGGPTAGDAPFGTPDSQPDGVTFTPIGDMDMDGLVAGGSGGAGGPWDMRWLSFTATGSPHGRIPVGVIIRWSGSSGREERYELWTVVSLFQESYPNAGGPDVLRFD